MNFSQIAVRGIIAICDLCYISAAEAVVRRYKPCAMQQVQDRTGRVISSKAVAGNSDWIVCEIARLQHNT